MLAWISQFFGRKSQERRSSKVAAKKLRWCRVQLYSELLEDRVTPLTELTAANQELLPWYGLHGSKNPQSSFGDPKTRPDGRIKIKPFLRSLFCLPRRIRARAIISYARYARDPTYNQGQETSVSRVRRIRCCLSFERFVARSTRRVHSPGGSPCKKLWPIA
jgi:hypothetical protein